MPQGNSKGQEQVASFQVLGGELEVREERMLANEVGKVTPEIPLRVSGGVGISRIPRRREKAAEEMAGRGWTSRQEPSCGR